MIEQPPLFKCCITCGASKPATPEYFRVQRGRLGNQCISCKLAAQKDWAKRNPSKKHAAQKRYRDTHPEAKVRQSAYRKTPKGRATQKQLDLRRRHRKATAEGSYGMVDVIAQYNRQQGQCFWCSCILTNETIQIDHIIPLSRYGTNWPSNIVCACYLCNASKGTKLPFIEWIPPRCLGR